MSLQALLFASQPPVIELQSSSNLLSLCPTAVGSCEATAAEIATRSSHRSLAPTKILTPSSRPAVDMFAHRTEAASVSSFRCTSGTPQPATAVERAEMPRLRSWMALGYILDSRSVEKSLRETTAFPTSATHLDGSTSLTFNFFKRVVSIFTAKRLEAFEEGTGMGAGVGAEPHWSGVKAFCSGSQGFITESAAWHCRSTLHQRHLDPGTHVSALVQELQSVKVSQSGLPAASKATAPSTSKRTITADFWLMG
mmetsp:Transcript_63274/g.136002  ORF Transcript_63274/g.136002 Transcript_63274/m.136002 type:complete len:253 (+) Transcript_63274:1882-2640(+)